MQFLTLAGEEFDRIQAAPADPLAEVRARLLAGRVSPMLGSTYATADAVLPGGELLSGAASGETCAGAF